MADYKEIVADTIGYYNQLCREKEAAKTPREFDRLEREFRRLMPFPGAKESAEECKARAKFGGGISKIISASEAEMKIDAQSLPFKAFLHFLEEVLPLPEKIFKKITAGFVYILNMILITLNIILNYSIFFFVGCGIIILNIFLIFFLKKAFTSRKYWGQCNLVLIIFNIVLVICLALRYFFAGFSIWMYICLVLILFMGLLFASMKLKG